MELREQSKLRFENEKATLPFMMAKNSKKAIYNQNSEAAMQGFAAP